MIPWQLAAWITVLAVLFIAGILTVGYDMVNRILLSLFITVGFGGGIAGMWWAVFHDFSNF